MTGFRDILFAASCCIDLSNLVQLSLTIFKTPGIYFSIVTLHQIIFWYISRVHQHSVLIFLFLRPLQVASVNSWLQC